MLAGLLALTTASAFAGAEQPARLTRKQHLCSPSSPIVALVAIGNDARAKEAVSNASRGVDEIVELVGDRPG